MSHARWWRPSPTITRLFYERFFGHKFPEKEASRLDGVANLAPGDFRTVRQSFWYFGDEVTDAERVDALAAEAKAKAEGTEAGTRRVGF